MRRGRCESLIALTGIACLTGLASAAVGDAAPPATGKVTAGIVSTTGGPGRGTARLTVWIDRYTADDETQRWVELVAGRGQDFLVNVWQNERPVVGRVKISGSVACDLRVARSRPTDRGRKIVLVTDRPISGYEIRHGLQETDYPFAWIELDLDARGEGTGTLVPAVRLTVKDGALQIEGSGVDPLRLLGVALKTK